VIAEAPCRQVPNAHEINTIPFSGKKGVLGYRIIADYKKANQVTENDWQEEQFKNYHIVSPNKKPVKAVTMKLTLENFEKSGDRHYHESNFGALHKTGIYPVAEKMLMAD